MRVLVTQKCSEGRKENYWFTDSTNEIEAMVRKFGRVGEYFRQIYVTHASWEHLLQGK